MEKGEYPSSPVSGFFENGEKFLFVLSDLIFSTKKFSSAETEALKQESLKGNMGVFDSTCGAIIRIFGKIWPFVSARYG